MDDEALVEDLTTTTEQSAEVMEGKRMSQAEFAAAMTKVELAKMTNKPAPAPADETEPNAEAESIEDDADAMADGKKSDDQEQSEEQPDAEDSPVLSKLDPKTQEKIQKRIGKVTARAKEAEEKLAAALLENETLKGKQTETEASPVVVAADDPNDKTAAANTDADLQQLENDASNTLEFLDVHDLAITRAIAKDQDKVVLGGQEFNVADLMEFKRNATRHINKLIPARRAYLADKSKATTEAKTILPALFDKSTADYQEWVAFQRKNPATRNIPSFERIYALAKIGEKTVAANAKKSATTKASEVAPKTGADTGASAAAAKPKSGSSSTEKARLTVELGRAVKSMEASRSQAAYQKVLILQDRIKKLN